MISVDINQILIEEVKKRPLLYNSSAFQQEKGVRNQMRRQLWYEVYNSLNQLIPYARIPKIWKNIRDRYHKVKRLIDNNKDGNAQIRPKYRYFEMLSFLDREYDPQKENQVKAESFTLVDHPKDE